MILISLVSIYSGSLAGVVQYFIIFAIHLNLVITLNNHQNELKLVFLDENDSTGENLNEEPLSYQRPWVINTQSEIKPTPPILPVFSNIEPEDQLQTTCQICYFQVAEEDHITTPCCLVSYHLSHLITWLEMTSICPNCRFKLTTERLIASI